MHERPPRTFNYPVSNRRPLSVAAAAAHGDAGRKNKGQAGHVPKEKGDLHGSRLDHRIGALHSQLAWVGESGNDQEACIRSEGSTNEETASGGTQRSGNWKANRRPLLRQPRTKRRGNLTTATTTQADLSRHALELKLSHPAPPHPGSGPAGSKGKKSKESQKPLRAGASKGEVGRVSQEGKVAQARKDSGDRYRVGSGNVSATARFANPSKPTNSSTQWVACTTGASLAAPGLHRTYPQ